MVLESRIRMSATIASNTMTNINLLKKLLGKKYKMKDLGKAKTITGQQIIRDTVAGTIKIDQLAFIKDFVIEESLINYKVNMVSMKPGSVIEMTSLKDYEKTKL